MEHSRSLTKSRKNEFGKKVWKIFRFFGYFNYNEPWYLFILWNFIQEKFDWKKIWSLSAYFGIVLWMWCKLFERLDGLIYAPQKAHIDCLFIELYSIRVSFTSLGGFSFLFFQISQDSCWHLWFELLSLEQFASSFDHKNTHCMDRVKEKKCNAHNKRRGKDQMPKT